MTLNLKALNFQWKFSKPNLAKIFGHSRSYTFYLFSVLAAFIFQYSYEIFTPYINNEHILIPWDDCYILYENVKRVQALFHAGGWREALFILSPHSPMADFQSVIGVLIWGFQPFFLYFLNIWASIVSIVAILYATPSLRMRKVVVLVILFLTQSVTHLSMVIVKADWKAAILLAAAFYVAYQGIQLRKRHFLRVASALYSLSIICKLTTVYVPFIALVFVGLINMAYDAAGPAIHKNPRRCLSELRSETIREIMISSIIVTAPFLILFEFAIPHGIIEYIFGALQPLWHDGLSPIDRLVNYGPTQNVSWGWLPIEFLCVGMTAFAIGRRSDLRLISAFLCVAVIILLMYFGVLVTSRTSNFEFFGPIIGIVLGLTLIFAERLADFDRKDIWSNVGIWIFVALSFMGGFVTAPYLQPRNSIYQVTHDGRASSNYISISAEIYKYKTTKEPMLWVFFEDQDAPFPNLSLLYFKTYGAAMVAERMDGLSSDIEQSLDKGLPDFLLLLKPEPTKYERVGYNLQKMFWTSAHLASVAAAVEAKKQYRVLDTFSWPGGRLELLGRRGAPAI